MQRVAIAPLLFMLVGCSGRTAVAKPLSEQPLLSYLSVGSKRVAFGPDTLVESGKRMILIPTTFDGASRTVGPSALGAKGDGGEALQWMCYRLTGEPSMSLVLEADETSGGHLGGFEFLPADSRPEVEGECISLDVPPSQIATNTGLRLGMSRDEVSGKLGVDGLDSAGVVIFKRVIDRSVQRSNGDQQQSTHTASFIVWFQDDRVVRFNGWRVDA